MKKIITIVLSAVILISASIFGAKEYRQQKIKALEETISPIPESVQELPVTESQLTYAFDVLDTEKLVGFVDYMFVAKVEKITGTIYEGVVYNPDKRSYSGLPYTCYEITVTENIKGNLKLDETIPMRKLGGVSVDGKTYCKFGSEEALEQGKYYLFLGYADENGELYVCDTNSTIELDTAQNANSTVSVLSESVQVKEENDELLKKYKDAFKNQDLSVRAGERYVSKYES